MTTARSVAPATDVHRWRLTADSGLAIELLDLGATLHRIEIPDEDSEMVPLSLSLDGVAAHEDPIRNPYLGPTIGRWANRLARAEITIDGLTHALQANEGNNQLHGGAAGFSQWVWAGEETAGGVRFHRTSPDGEMGFPGNLDVTVTYELSDHKISILHEATTDAATVVSMTNHTYWNLGGADENDIGDHRVLLAADFVVPVDAESLPSGPPHDVTDTPFDLRSATQLGDRLGFSLPNGFDHCFMIDGAGLRRHARVSHPSGRVLEVWSDQPAVQFYTGAFLSGGAGADGRHHDPFSGLCLEPQLVPDAPNLDWTPSAILRPGERYVHHLEFHLYW